MTETFHQFLQLPWELREEIWYLATRRKRPGAHAFSIYHIEKDQDADRSMDMGFDEKHWFWDVTQRLSAPKGVIDPSKVSANCNRGQQIAASWTWNNKSTYAIDGGLWTACKESRFIMQRIFPETNRKLEEATATSYFMGQDLVRHYFTVLPHQDLFILQPFCFNTFDLENVNYSIPLGSSIVHFNGLKNIALEFDPSWGRAVRASQYESYRPIPVIECILRAIREGMCFRYIWIIDYGIKRTQNVRNKDERRWPNHVFYQESRRFVQCDYFNLGRKWDDSDAYGCSGISGREFVDELVREIDALFVDVFEEDLGDSYDRPFVSLMACEYF